MKEEIIKKVEDGSEMIEEILFISEMIKKKYMIKMKGDVINIINSFINTGKDKGFEGKLYKNKNDILSEEIYINWIELFNKDVCIIIL